MSHQRSTAADSDSPADAHPTPHSNADTNTYADADTDTYANADTYADTNAHSNANPDTDAHASGAGERNPAERRRQQVDWFVSCGEVRGPGTFGIHHRFDGLHARTVQLIVGGRRGDYRGMADVGQHGSC